VARIVTGKIVDADTEELWRRIGGHDGGYPASAHRSYKQGKLESSLHTLSITESQIRELKRRIRQEIAER
jgi:hypothetical protein